ncbi:MAG: hypothetical protein WBP29_10955 [Candidatus Zixiibacteriota bacterium]
MDPRLLIKYGEPNLARYFVKSLEDLLDVVETVYKHVSQQVDTQDLNEVLAGIECFASPIPRTLSSHIFGFAIPSQIMDSENRATVMAPRPPDMKIPAASQPQIVHQNGKTMLVKEISSLYDIVVFQRFFKSLMNANSDGIKMFTTKRSAEVKIGKLASSETGFQLVISFPGIFFKGQALLTS